MKRSGPAPNEKPFYLEQLIAFEGSIRSKLSIISREKIKLDKD